MSTWNLHAAAQPLRDCLMEALGDWNGGPGWEEHKHQRGEGTPPLFPLTQPHGSQSVARTSQPPECAVCLPTVLYYLSQ